MARTVEAALPVRLERLGLCLEFVPRRAAKMRANADHHQVLGLDRAEFVACVFRSELLLALALRIGDPALALLDRIQHFLGAPHDPHRLSPPFDAASLTRGALS